MSYAGLGQVSTAPTAVVGRDSSRYEAGGAVRVSARWAQRAANAGLRYNNRYAPLIAVDGRAGPITIAKLREHSHQFSSDQPVTNDPPTSRITSTVIIPVALETRLATLPFVRDPPVSAATVAAVPSTSTTPATPSAPPVIAPIPGATPATPADTVILDEGSSGGLIARYGIWPFVIGGTALAGLGVWFLMGGGSRVRANRRRSPKRNPVVGSWSRYHASVGGEKRRRLSSVDAHALAQRRAEEEGFSGRSGIYSGWHEGRGMPGLGKKRRVQRNRLTARQRARLPKKAFVFPSRRAWPIDNARRAYAAIQFLRMGRVRSASDFNEVRNVVRRRYPKVWDLYGKNLTWDRAKAAKARRRSSRRRSTRGAPRRMVANSHRRPGFKPPPTVSRAWRDSGGTIHFGDWIVPVLGSSRFKTKKQADDYVKWFVSHYPGIFGTKVAKEPSRSRPGAFSYQVYIRSLGKMEGLR